MPPTVSRTKKDRLTDLLLVRVNACLLAPPAAGTYIDESFTEGLWVQIGKIFTDNPPKWTFEPAINSVWTGSRLRHNADITVRTFLMWVHDQGHLNEHLNEIFDDMIEALEHGSVTITRT